MDLRTMFGCAVFLSLALAAGTQELKQEEVRSNSEPIFKTNKEFINPGAPAVTIPPIKGERYQTQVPDTIDIAERGKLAIHGLTSPLDPDDGYALYWNVNYATNPPVMRKEAYLHLRAKCMEALFLLRLATGSNLNDNVDQVWTNNMLKMIGPDGLFYAATKRNGKHFSLAACGTSRLLGLVMLYYQHDRDPQWKAIVEKSIQRLTELAVDKGDWAYFAQSQFEPDAKPLPNAPVPVTVQAINEYNGRIVQQLGQCYALTGFTPAKKLGDKLINFILHHSQYFGPYGEWLKDKRDPQKYPGRYNDIHMGNHSHVLLYMTDYALGTKNRELLNTIQKSFEHGLKLNSTVPGQCETATKIGFFIEYLNPYYPTAEHCGVADLVGIALKLSRAGVGDYWDQADGWIRNHFIENQITSPNWIDNMPRQGLPREPNHDETVDNVVERNVGNFFGWPAANDGCPHGSGHMDCCLGNGSKTLYYIWEHILEGGDGRLKINLLMNRASVWADVDSYIPYTGRVDIKVKKTLTAVLMRAPQWVADGSTALKCTVNGKPRAVAWEGRYVNVGAASPNDVIALTFPISERTIERRVYGQPLETVMGGVVYDSITFRGNEVVDIKPEGKNYPYYQRDYYRTGVPRMLKVERFISIENILW